MNDCRSVRDRLAQAATPDPALQAHLDACPECAALARRWSLARQAFQTPDSGLQPDPGFALRVVSRLPQPAELLGWAALRVLPAALALAVALTWMGLWQPADPSRLLVEEPSADVLFTYAAAAPREIP